MAPPHEKNHRGYYTLPNRVCHKCTPRAGGVVHTCASIFSPGFIGQSSTRLQTRLDHCSRQSLRNSLSTSSVSLTGDNNGWPHLFDKYFGMPTYNTATKSNICCEYQPFIRCFRLNSSRVGSDFTEVFYVKQLSILIIFSQQQQLHFKLDLPSVVILLFCWQLTIKGGQLRLLLFMVAHLHVTSRVYCALSFIAPKSSWCLMVGQLPSSKALVHNFYSLCFFVSKQTARWGQRLMALNNVWDKSSLCSDTTIPVILSFGFCAPQTALGWICRIYWLDNTSWRALGRFVTSCCCWGGGLSEVLISWHRRQKDLWLRRSPNPSRGLIVDTVLSNCKQVVFIPCSVDNSKPI